MKLFRYMSSASDRFDIGKFFYTFLIIYLSD